MKKCKQLKITIKTPLKVEGGVGSSELTDIENTDKLFPDNQWFSNIDSK
jgi:hypothetical protein